MTDRSDMARLAKLDAYVEQGRDRFVERLGGLIARPSVSTTGEGSRVCAEHLAGLMAETGLEARLLETEGALLVFGQLPGNDAWPTVLVTTHYDVQPVEPLELWQSPPYQPTQVGDRIFGRGSSDAKGPVSAVLAAVETVLQTGGLDGVNLKVLFDGEEEIGSPSLPGAIARYDDLLAADAVVTFDGNSLPDGRPLINFGGGGILYLDLGVRTARNDIHANRGALVPNALWRMVWALASLKDAQENILIDGFSDAISRISARDLSLLDSHPWSDAAELASIGADEFIPRDGHSGNEALHLLPIVGIAGLHGGYDVDGVAAVLPSNAGAKLYIGLRHAQSPEDVAAKIRAHLDRNGFADVTTTIVAGTEPSGHRTDSALARLVESEITKLYGRPAAVYPRANWYGRQASWIGSRIGAHACQISMIAPPQPNNHGPNEYIDISYLLRGIRFISRFILQASGLPRRGAADYGAIGPQL